MIDRNDSVKKSAETNRFEAKTAIKEFVKDVFNYVGGDYTDTQGGIIADHVLLDIPAAMTFNQLEEAFRRGMKESDITRRPSPKNFCDWVRQREKQGLNVMQDGSVSTNRPAPQGSGNDDLDTKRNIMAMWAAMKTWRDDIPDVERRLGGNWGREYAYLKAHGLVSEPQGWLDDYRERAVNYIRGGEDGAAGSIRDIISGRRMREEILRDGGQVMDTVYRLRVTDTMKSWLEASFDGFNTWFNSVTQDTPSAFVTLTNDIYRFKIY